MARKSLVAGRWIGAAMGLWLLFASIVSLPYQVVYILPDETYYRLKDRSGSAVLLLKTLRDVLKRLTN
jgi:hypothetical protein